MLMKLFALAVLAGGQPVSAFAQPIPTVPARSTIVVDGYGEVRTTPDIATISYTLRGEGATSDEAVRAMVAAGARIGDALRGVDVAAEPRTSKVEVSPAKGSNCKDEDYDSGVQLSKGACAIVGFIATQTVTIQTTGINDAGTMVGLAGRGGAYNARINDFDLSDPAAAAAKKQALTAALMNAQAKAFAIAAGTHLTIGQILNVTTGDRGAVTTISSQEVRLNSLPQSFAAPPPVVVNLKPELIKTAGSVTVTYAIAQ